MQNKRQDSRFSQARFLRAVEAGVRARTRCPCDRIVLTSALVRCIEAGGGSLRTTRSVRRESVSRHFGEHANTVCFAIDDRVVAARCIRLPMMPASSSSSGIYAEAHTYVITYVICRRGASHDKACAGAPAKSRYSSVKFILA